MPWTYDPSQLSTNILMQVRAEIQDTDPNDPKLLDEEISYALTFERNMWGAAARCCEMIARKRLSRADPKLGRAMQVIYSKAAQQYYDMAKCLRQKSMGSVAPYAGGMLVADKETIGRDNSLVAPQFTKTMMENPWAGGYTTDSADPVSNEESNIDPNSDFV